MDTLGHTLMVIYVMSGLFVAVGLLLLHETVYYRLRLAGRLRTPLHHVKYVVLLLVLILVPVVNTACVLFTCGLFLKSITSP